MNYEQEDAPIIVEVEGPVATVWMNRPEVHNALNAALIGALTAVFRQMSQREDVRVVVLGGVGRSFCAGADLSYMRATATAEPARNTAEGRAIFDLLLSIDSCPKPVLGRVNGAAIGGGAGLVSCCDIVIAAEGAAFAFSEVRLGVVPAVISPFVVSKIGMSAARQLFLSGERFDAQAAQRFGLVHDVVGEDQLKEQVSRRLEQLLAGAPGAQAAIKELIRVVNGRVPLEMREYTSNLIAERRASAEGQEGMSAFLEKRAPHWRSSGDA